MGLLRIAAAGALGYFAYQAWQHRGSAAPAIENDAPAGSDRPAISKASDDAHGASDDDAAATPGAG